MLNMDNISKLLIQMKDNKLPRIHDASQRKGELCEDGFSRVRGLWTAHPLTMFTSVQFVHKHGTHTQRIWLKNCISSLRVKKCPVIWCVSCLIHGCSLTRLPMSNSSSSPFYPFTHREHSVHPAHLQVPSVDKLRHQESLWRDDQKSGGNPRTTIPTGCEPLRSCDSLKNRSLFWISISTNELLSPKKCRNLEIGRAGLPISKIS